MACINSPPPLLGPSGQIPGLPSPWQQPAHRAPPLRAFHQAVVQGGGREGLLLPLGDWRVGGGIGRSDPTDFSCVFQRRKWKKPKCCQQMLLCYPTDSGRSEVVTWVGTRGPLQKASPNLSLENHPIEESKTTGFRMGAGRSSGLHHPFLRPSRDYGAQPAWALSQADLPTVGGATMVPLERVRSLVWG